MNNIVRAFVVVLALTGAVASSQASSVAAPRTGVIGAAKITAMPTPMCPLDDPNACGIANH